MAAPYNAPPPAAQPTAPPPTAWEVAVFPASELNHAELGSTAAAINTWLLKNTGDYVNLERIKTAASLVPVVSNVMALMSLVSGVMDLIERKVEDDFENALRWCSIAIDAVGLIPGPGSAARTTLRPMVYMARQAKLAKQNLVDAAVATIEGHFSAMLMGELEAFLKGAEERIKALIEQAKALVTSVFGGLAQALRNLASGNVKQDEEAARKALEQSRKAALAYDPGAVLDSLWDAATHILKAEVKVVVTAVASLDKGIIDAINRFAAIVDNVGKTINKNLDAHAAAQVAGGGLTILALVRDLRQAIGKHKAKGKDSKGAANVVVPPNGTASGKTVPGKPLEVTNKQDPATGSAGPKNCPACSGAGGSIQFARGEETLTHTDFVLDCPLPITWARTYRSNLAGYEHDGPLGARWITPYTQYILEQDPDSRGTPLQPKGGPRPLVFFAADGRSHDWPGLSVGQGCRDGTEEIDVVRLSDQMIALNYGGDLLELYERNPTQPRYRLAMLKAKQGQITVLAYSEAGPLTDVMVRASDKPDAAVLAHMRCVYDPADPTHIQRIIQLKNHEPFRTLATYTYSHTNTGTDTDNTTGCDLSSAQDHNAATWTYQYNHHLLTRYTDRTNRGMNLHYDGVGLNARAVREYADDGSFDISLRWAPNIRLTYLSDAHGNQTRIYTNLKGYTYRVIHPDGMEEWFIRDKNANVTQHIHTNGSTDLYDYDERSRLLRHVRQDGSIVYFAWDEHNNLSDIRDGEANLWKREYNPAGLLTAETDPLGNVTEYAYNAAGLPIEIKDAKGGAKAISYTASGKIASYTDCSGKTSAWSYDSRDRLTKATNSAGEATLYQYGEDGQLASITHPDKTQEFLQYDAEGRLLRHTDALGRHTAYDYSAAGLVSNRLDAKGQRVDYVWDKLGRLTQLRNQNGATYSFAYDAVDKLLKEVGFDGKATWYHYSSDSGELESVFDGQSLTSLEFDAMGRLAERKGLRVQEYHQDAAGKPVNFAFVPESQRVESYIYNHNGQLAYAKNGFSALQWQFDAAGNVVREVQQYRIDGQERSAVWMHRYDELNQRIQTTRPDGQRINLLTYGSGHVHGVLWNDESLADFERDDAHREVLRSTASFERQTKYDPAGRIASQVAEYAKGLGHTGTGTPKTGVLSKRQYAYDKAGQLVQIQDQRRGTIDYRYDPVGQLLSANSALGQEVFAFDPAGNLKDPDQSDMQRANEVHNPLRNRLMDNLLRDYVGTHYTYDKIGNIIEKRVGGVKIEKVHPITNEVVVEWRGGVVYTYTWNSLNRLESVTTEKGVISFFYDALGRRAGKQAQAHAVFSNPADGPLYARTQRENNRRAANFGMTLFGWDGDQMAWEWRNLPQNPGLTHYLYEPGSFVPLAQVANATATMKDILVEPEYAFAEDPWYGREVKAGAVAHYHCDHLGTPQELTDEAGELVWSAHYKAWGQAKEVISEAAKRAGFLNPLRFQGQYYDFETGLHYNRHRYYDPECGRFISRDPVGLKGGLNLQQYVQNPIQWFDPNGLCSTALNKNLGGVSYDGMQAHHLIPEEIWDRHDTFFNKIGMGGMKDSKSNGLLMPDSVNKAKKMKKLFYHCGSHGNYSGRVDTQVARIENDFNNGRIDAQTAKNKIEELQIASRLTLSAPLLPKATPIRIN